MLFVATLRLFFQRSTYAPIWNAARGRMEKALPLAHGDTANFYLFFCGAETIREFDSRRNCAGGLNAGTSSSSFLSTALSSGCVLLLSTRAILKKMSV